MICVSISQWKQLEQVRDLDAGFLELRLDLIRKDPESIFNQLPRHTDTLVTCRPGFYSEQESMQQLKTSMDLGATYVDVEIESPDSYLNSLSAHASLCGTKLIVSYHNYELTPEADELESILQRCYSRGGDLAKIAVQANCLQDVQRLLSLYALPGKKVILGMGKQGRITRLMGPYLGAEFTFASPDAGEETAAGQLSYRQIKEIYKVIDES